MFKQWFAAHRSLVVTATSGTVVAAVVAAVAVVSTGYTAQRLDLNDSSVWVANGLQQSIGRANTTVHELNTVVSTTGTDVDVLQNSSTVLLVDNTESKLEMVDPATSTVTQSVPLPPNQPQVFLSDENVIILARSTGQVWITPIADLSAFDSQAPSDLNLGAGVVASMDETGTMYAYSPTAKVVDRILPDVSDVVQSTQKLALTSSDDFSITSVANSWAILDATTHKVYVNGASVDLAGTAAADGAVLQSASASGDRILVAGTAGLIGISLDGSSTTTEVTGQTGTASAPLVAAGCEFAAWSNAQAWRKCGTANPVSLTLGAMTTNAKLALRWNGNRVVLNDSRSGATWAVQGQGELINNWDDLIAPKDQHQQSTQRPEDTPPEVEKQQLPPVAQPDDLGARPGRTSVLPVLLNDYDPNGDVLAITDVTSINAEQGHLDLINDRQQLQLTLTSTASGTISFHYTISDGRGGTASAAVTVAVRTPGENSAPKQVRTSKTIVVQGGRVTTQVLSDWIDPDGDPFYLTSATAADPDSVSYKPEGTVVYSDAGKGGGGLKTVALEVSDGKATGTGSLAVTVKPAGKVPIIADPFIVIATAGQELTVSPLDHVRGGTGALRLNSVPSKTGVTITPSYESGTFRFESTQISTHYLDYVVTDGNLSVTGVVRVDVMAPPDPSSKPITIPKTVFVRSLSSAEVDVADSDIDPSGGVLLVTGIQNLEETTGVTAEILEQRVVRVTLGKPLEAPVSFNYRVSNGLADAQGIITVVEIPTPVRLQPPIANDDSITVRVGAAVDIPVLANDEDPDGEDLTLNPTLAQNLPDGAGLLFASGKVLRYLAPQRPGNYNAVYEISGPDGQTARAQLKIAVREADVDTNNPPVPQTLTARALAGGTVVIKVPLSGIDPDGDTVQLLGQETNPEKGIVTAVGPSSITYTAGDYSAGTDTFTYTVIDALGARATGTVRVGISPRLSGAPNPVATLDEVTVRPGVTVSVQVLANDSDPDGSPLHVVSAVPNDKDVKAKIVNDVVTIKPPIEPKTYGVVYTIENATGGTSSAFVRVTVDPKAPLSFPVASDTVLTLSDVLDRTSVDVNVLANVFFADGNSSELGLSVYPGFGSTAQVTPSKHIRVDVTAHSQIIPFKVTHPDDPNVFSYAFIWVPGTDDALPQLNRNAGLLTVTSGQRLVISLNKYVIAVGGKKVRLTDSSSVRATHDDGTSLVVDSGTLQYTSAPHYFGPASISFEVTDGVSATDPNGRKSILVLPIKVLPTDNQPPIFTGGVIDFQPGEHKIIDLVKLTNYPHVADLDQLVYDLVAPLPKGFTTSLDRDGQHLSIGANVDTTAGTIGEINVGVRDTNSVGTSGRIELVVVPSSRPLAEPAPDEVNVKRGDTTTVDPLDNDEATNPFPGKPLRVVAIRGLDGNSLPAGLTVTPNATRTRLTVTTTNAAEAIDTNLQYEVADVTGDPSRYVWGAIRISVQDKPDPVTNVRITDFSDRRVTVAWNNGPANNSPITSYAAIMTDATTGATVSTTDCSGSLCQLTTPGNGPDNAVRVAVVEKNAIGASDPTSAPSAVWSDIVPGAPTDVDSSPLDHGLRITWTKPPESGSGSDVTKYVITVEGTSSVEVSVPGGDPVGTQYTRSITDAAIDNGSSVAYSVSARNGALSSLANWNRATGTGHPAGPPLRQSGISVSINPDSGSVATLNWDGDFSSNGRAVSNYYASVSTGASSVTCGVNGDVPGSPDVPDQSSTFQHLSGTATSTTFNGLTPNTTYTFVVYAFNGMGCTASAPVVAVARVRPGTVTSIDASGPSPSGTNTWDFRLNDFTIASGSTDADGFEYRLSGGSVEGGVHGPSTAGAFLLADNGSQYGQDISVEVKACRQFPEGLFCSANWSAPFHLGVPVRSTDLGSLAFTHDPFQPVGAGTPGSWSWTSSPNGAYDSITYSCGSGSQDIAPGDGGTCDNTDTGVLVHDFPDLRITINVNGSQYVRTYDWNNYD
ncbi:MAG: tandem-95 repeat protein [Glaciihabitans sp.]|nr:tandem-95 repeat protein [Glaciihabitans sp.]